MELDQQVGGEAVKFLLARRFVVDRFAQPHVAEIAEQEQALVKIAGNDFGSGQADRGEPFGDRDEWPRILMRRGCVHQHRLPALADHAKVAAERGVAGERLDAGLGPSTAGKKLVDPGGRNHGVAGGGGHRPSHAAGTSAVKRRRSGPVICSVRRSASGQAEGPARSGHSTNSTASSSIESRPISASSEGSSMR